MKPLKKKGFTLVELLVTVSIIGIIIAIGAASYNTVNKQSRDTKRKSDVEQIRSALEMYRADNGSYPDAGSGSWVEASDPDNGTIGLTPALVSTYIPVIPTDPLDSQSYMYKATNISGATFYGYCLSTKLEGEDPADSCTPSTGHTYGVKNP